MSMKRTVPSALAATVLAVTALAVPVAQAEAADTSPTMEQRSAAAKTAIQDAWIDGRLESAMLFNEHLNPFDIHTDVRNGVVYLTGTVESDIDRDLAGELAQSIDGVIDVKNELVVDETKARDARDSEAKQTDRGFQQSVVDATLTARIKTQLLADSNTSGLAINVDTDNGVVSLTGTVGSDEEKALAARIAENTEGTRSLVNQLAVDQED